MDLGTVPEDQIEKTYPFRIIAKKADGSVVLALKHPDDNTEN